MNRKSKSIYLLALFVILCMSLIMASCSVSVTGITLDKTTAAMKVGEKLTLTATVSPQDAEAVSVEWTTSDEEIATVVDGEVIAIANGKVTITATVKQAASGIAQLIPGIAPSQEEGDFFATCEITVTTDVKGVAMDRESVKLVPGENTTLEATVTPATASEKGVVWASDNEAVATVKDGVVSAVAPGVANISVTTVDGGPTASCQVTVAIPVTGVTLDQSEITMIVSDTVTLNATVAPENASEKGIVWASDNEKVATVKDGVVTAVSSGVATVSVTTVDGAFVAQCTVRAYVPVAGVELTSKADTLKIGQTLPLVLALQPADATNRNVEWTTSDENIATVENGTVTGIGQGEVTITVTTEEGSFTASVTLTIIGFDNKQAELSVAGELLQGHVAVNDAVNSIVEWKGTEYGKIYYVYSTEELTRSQLIGHESAVAVEYTAENALSMLQIASENILGLQYVLVENAAEITVDTKVSDVMALNWTENEFFTPAEGTINTWEALKEALTKDADITLGSNIDAESEEYAPTLNLYKSNFNGNGFAILNLNIVGQGNNVGLFKQACTPATFADILFINPSITATGCENVGLLFGTNTEPANNVITISNVHVMNMNLVGDKNKVGGFIGWIKGATADVNVNNCSVDMKATYSGENFGGIIGLVNWNSTITVTDTDTTVCLQDCNVLRAGGIIGSIDSGNLTLTVTNCNGKVIANGGAVRYIGGALGRVNSSKLFANGGAYSVYINNATGEYHGGFAGGCDGGAVVTVNEVALSYVQQSSKINRTGGFSGGCFGTANVTLTGSEINVSLREGDADERKGGFIGQTDSSCVMTIANCQINIEIGKNVTAFGGLVGAIDGKSKLAADFVVVNMNLKEGNNAGATNDVFGYYGGVNETDGVIINNSVFKSNHRASTETIYGQRWNDPADPVLNNVQRIQLSDSVSEEMASVFVGETNEGAAYWTYEDGELVFA